MDLKEQLRLVVANKPRETNRILPYACLEEFVLKFGRPCRNQRLPSRFKQRSYKKLCYRNSKIMADKYKDELTYVEGFATVDIDSPVYVLHAWCVDTEGYVYDSTRAYVPEREYFGIPFKASYVNKIYQQTKQYGILDRWEEGWPVFFADPEECFAP